MPESNPRPSTSDPNGDAPGDGFPQGPSALDSPYAEEFPTPLVDVDAIISGGPPPDGIPPIDEPSFISVAENPELLPAEEAVIALDINGDARAYPVRAMVWHEIANDTVGGVPVTVTYCPLCNSAATYERTIDGQTTTFGTSGKLFASALVMYDRATESLWTHFNGMAVVGMLTGVELVEHPSPLLAWSDFVESYPEGSVLDWESAGFNRDYGRNPYSGYDTPDGDPFLFRGSLDNRASAMQRVVGVELENTSVAFAVSAIDGGEAHATNTVVGTTDIVILWKAGQASALEGNKVDAGRDVGSVGVFRAELDGTTLTFEAMGSGFHDAQTGSLWTIAGEAIGGPLAGHRLERIPHLDTFWFAWSTYQPDTTLISE
ncbi:MAG: DUF3179 domain-containing protein [Acidimicrobiia bacterium]